MESKYPKSGNVQLGQNSGYYITKKYLGGGAFGSVWEGYHIKNPSCKYAIKKVDMLSCIKKGKGAHNLQLIRNEVNVLAALKPLYAPNIVSFVDFVEEPAANVFYIVMERVKGTRLKELSKNMILQNIYSILKQICTGLKCLHDKGLVHRDIKPENIILNTEGRVVIVDLGLACKERNEDEKKNHNILKCTGEAGTRGYKDPLMIQEGKTTSKSDIYSLGISLFRILVGKKPKLAATHTSYDSDSSTSTDVVMEELKRSYIEDATTINDLEIPSKIKKLVINMINPYNSESRHSASDIINDCS